MNLSMTDEQRAMVEVAARFAEKEIAPRVRDYDREERFPSEIYDMMGELGLTGGIIPEAYGGAGMSYVTYSLIIMELARHCQALAGAASWASGIVGASVLTFGTEEQKRRYLQPLAMGKGPAAFALTEPHTGSDVASLRTRAERVAGGYLLRGSKVWVSMIGSCHWMVALATVDPKLGRKGVTAFILEPGWKGLIRNPFKNKLGFRPMETGEIVFDDVFVPEENRLGAEGEGFRVAMCAVEGGRLGVASRCCGMIRACLEESVSYAKSRTTFGKPIAEYQLIQSKITDMSVAYETSRLLTLQLASLKDTGGRAREQASMAKMHASDMLMRSAEQAMQIHGAYGCSDEYAVSRLFRDAKFMQVIEGTNEIHRVLIAEYAAGLRH